MEELLSAYRHEYDILFCEYELMGMLLNRNQILRRIEELNLESCYIYGGGFLGIQCYRSICNEIDVKAVVDISGGLKFDLPDIKVIDLEMFKEIYHNEIVIISPVKFSSEIHEKLVEFIDDDRLLCLGEFVQGDLG